MKQGRKWQESLDKYDGAVYDTSHIMAAHVIKYYFEKRLKQRGRNLKATLTNKYDSKNMYYVGASSVDQTSQHLSNLQVPYNLYDRPYASAPTEGGWHEYANQAMSFLNNKNHQSNIEPASFIANKSTPVEAVEDITLDRVQTTEVLVTDQSDGISEKMRVVEVKVTPH